MLRRVFAQVRRLLPDAKVEHIGATAVDGALTKGDVDIVVRVRAARFAAAVATLRARYDVKQRENWTKHFASFGDDAGHELPLGIQLVALGSEADFLSFLRDHLIANPKALAAYNRLKLRHAPRGAEDYWKAKHAFFTKILAAHDR